MLNFSGWPRKLGSPFNWDSQKGSKMRHIVKFRPQGTPYGKSGHGTPWYYGWRILDWTKTDSETSWSRNMIFSAKITDVSNQRNLDLFWCFLFFFCGLSVSSQKLQKCQNTLSAANLTQFRWYFKGQTINPDFENIYFAACLLLLSSAEQMKFPHSSVVANLHYSR